MRMNFKYFHKQFIFASHLTKHFNFAEIIWKLVVRFLHGIEPSLVSSNCKNCHVPIVVSSSCKKCHVPIVVSIPLTIWKSIVFRRHFLRLMISMLNWVRCNSYKNIKWFCQHYRLIWYRWCEMKMSPKIVHQFKLFLKYDRKSLWTIVSITYIFSTNNAVKTVKKKFKDVYTYTYLIRQKNQNSNAFLGKWYKHDSYTFQIVPQIISVRVTFDGTFSFLRKCLKTCAIFTWDRTDRRLAQLQKCHVPIVVSISFTIWKSTVSV